MKINLVKIRPYAKAVVAIAGAIVAAGNVVLSGGSTLQIAIAVLTALGVHQVKNG